MRVIEINGNSTLLCVLLQAGDAMPVNWVIQYLPTAHIGNAHTTHEHMTTCLALMECQGHIQERMV